MWYREKIWNVAVEKFTVKKQNGVALEEFTSCQLNMLSFEVEKVYSVIKELCEMWQWWVYDVECVEIEMPQYKRVY